jgi:hypothetical protein
MRRRHDQPVAALPAVHNLILIMVLTSADCTLNSTSATAHEPSSEDAAAAAATAARLAPPRSHFNCSVQQPPPVTLFTPRYLARAALPLIITFQPDNKSQGQDLRAWQR